LPEPSAAGPPARAVHARHVPGTAVPSGRGLDAFTFLVSNLQTGFGPFVNAYLTQQKWTQGDIGLVMTLGGLVGLVGQVPGGALVDRARDTRRVAAVSVAVIALSALALAIWASFPFVLAAMVVHAAASCTLNPAISTLSLRLVGHAGAGARFGRNASFASVGGGIAALAMGACGYYLSDASVFYVTAAVGIPALLALRYVRVEPARPAPAHVARQAKEAPGGMWASLAALGRSRALLAFAGCVCLFHLANAAMMPLAGSALTLRSAQSGAPLIAACIVVPQIVVALGATWVGRGAQRFGRRPFLLLCFGALAARGVLFANADETWTFVAVQVLDGVSAASLGVLMPLVIADATRGTGHFNLAFGAVATGMAVGASVATTLWGYVADHQGMSGAFLGMAAVAAAGALLAAFAMPETRPAERVAMPPARPRARLRGKVCRVGLRPVRRVRHP
jgi:MFS family permease